MQYSNLKDSVIGTLDSVTDLSSIVATVHKQVSRSTDQRLLGCLSFVYSIKTNRSK